MIDNLNRELANQIFQDLTDLEKSGYWKDGKAPEWVQEIARHYEVATGAMIITANAYRALAIFYKTEFEKLEFGCKISGKTIDEVISIVNK